MKTSHMKRWICSTFIVDTVPWLLMSWRQDNGTDLVFTEYLAFSTRMENKSNIKCGNTLRCLDQYRAPISIYTGGECPPVKYSFCNNWSDSKMVFAFTLVDKPDIDIWLWHQSNSKWDTFLCLKLNWPWRSKSINPKTIRILTICVLHLLSQFGDSSLNGWWAITQTSSGPLFTKKTPSYQYRDSHYKPEMVVRPSKVYNSDPYTRKTASS